ncbi:uncharacterized protein [Phyllobates terribilis]|uniref:uncharacterized protein n=1 Tax=Phyllobates terribilis TaxID=111132 RepID=UPI003CCB6CC6
MIEHATCGQIVESDCKVEKLIQTIGYSQIRIEAYNASSIRDLDILGKNSITIVAGLWKYDCGGAGGGEPVIYEWVYVNAGVDDTGNGSKLGGDCGGKRWEPSLQWSDDYDYEPPPPPFLCNLEDRATLLQIKQALGNTYLLNSWVPNSDCCNAGWHFVDCDPDTGRVANFEFYGNYLYADRRDIPPVFPEAIGNLTSLKALIFVNNATGVIPTFIKNLKNLTMLDLSHNRLTGRIPRFLTSLKGLRILSLDNNQLSGRIPPFLSNLTSIETLSLSNNMLIGRIPPDFLHSYVGGGLSLYLGSNKLVGQLPATFANVKFRVLSVQNNNLTGDASFVFGKDKWLWYIDISNNKFQFDISKLEMRSDFVSLLLSNNKLFGKLPASLVDLVSLYSLDVSYNRLCGRIPVGGKLQTFDPSVYSNNRCLCGAPLPPLTDEQHYKIIVDYVNKLIVTYDT